MSDDISSSPDFDPIPSWISEAALAKVVDWDEGGKCHNWRNHVGERVQAMWNTFTDDQKIAIASDADWRASCEEWD